MSNPSAGVQALLEAEREAAKIVEQARQYRLNRLREARVQAAAEIDALKSAKAKELQQYESEHSGSTSAAFDSVKQSTLGQLKAVADAFDTNRDAALKLLIDGTLKVEPKVHTNYRPTDAVSTAITSVEVSPSP
ncbi:V-type ATPase [Ramicandelaber brevisporus]|nr:V-type ATPase [Ramicandelaber brevisporus]KAI8868194.1 V-type ATPase [Ramicandelaber brevisporus]